MTVALEVALPFKAWVQSADDEEAAPPLHLATFRAFVLPRLIILVGHRRRVAGLRRRWRGHARGTAGRQVVPAWSTGIHVDVIVIKTFAEHLHVLGGAAHLLQGEVYFLRPPSLALRPKRGRHTGTKI